MNKPDIEDFNTWWNAQHKWDEGREMALDAYRAGVDAAEKEFKTTEVSLHLMLNRLWCSNHFMDAYIVHREPRVLLLHCGCAYQLDSTGVRFINTIAPTIAPSKERLFPVRTGTNTTNK